MQENFSTMIANGKKFILRKIERSTSKLTMQYRSRILEALG